MANLQTMVSLLGDLRRAAELQEQTLTAARRQVVPGFIRWQEAEAAMHAYWQGRWPDALAQADAFIAASEAGEAHYMDPVCRYIRGAISLAQGHTQAALADGRRATELARAIKDPQALNPAIAFEAHVELAVGNFEAANVLADELLAVWVDEGLGPLSESVDGAWGLTGLGRTDELEAAIRRCRAPTPWHEAAASVAAGDAARAADIYAEIGSVPDEAHARLRAAEQLVQEGRRADADAQLKLALPIFTRLGASAWRAEGESLLAKSA